MTDNARPNIVYIQSDQHNPAVIGAYGDQVVETPNLDRLAANGAIFTGAYCGSPICVPSRTALVTGRYPYETEVWTNDQILSSAGSRPMPTPSAQQDTIPCKSAACTSTEWTSCMASPDVT